MNIAIIGSRVFKTEQAYELLRQRMEDIICNRNVAPGNVTIVSGGAPGADTLGAQFAKEHGYDLIVHKADWSDLSHPDAIIRTGRYGKYDAKAGFRRNSLIVRDADICIAFHNGSNGTADTMRKFKVLGKEVIEFKFS